MSQISTHVLDTATGFPAKDVPVQLWHLEDDQHWTLLAETTTNSDGRAPDLMQPEIYLLKGTYRLHFVVENYLHKQQHEVFYPFIEVVFAIEHGQHYHIPLLISPFGYSTYRGS